jgi:hypothetical protein
MKKVQVGLMMIALTGAICTFSGCGASKDAQPDSASVGEISTESEDGNDGGEVSTEADPSLSAQRMYYGVVAQALQQLPAAIQDAGSLNLEQVSVIHGSDATLYGNDTEVHIIYTLGDSDEKCYYAFGDTNGEEKVSEDSETKAHDLATGKSDSFTNEVLDNVYSSESEYVENESRIAYVVDLDDFGWNKH